MVPLLEIAQKVTNLFWLLLSDKLLPRTNKNRPIWSHWLEVCAGPFVSSVGRKSEQTINCVLLAISLRESFARRRPISI